MVKRKSRIDILLKYTGLGTLTVLCIILAAAVLSCGGNPGKQEQPNILLITVDTLRADYLSVYGYKGHKTRNLDEFAQEGAVFDSAYCDVNWTTPSMASTLTGVYAYKHQLRSMYQKLPDAADTTAEHLKAAGYHTAAVIGAFPLDSIYNLDQGFDVYNDTFTGAIYSGPKPPAEIQSRWGDTVKERRQLFFKKIFNKSRRTDNEVTEAAIQILDGFSKKKGPFFLWVHYFGPHALPDVRRNRVENWNVHAKRYPEKVLNSDKAVGDLLSALDSYNFDNTLVIFHADHGESLWEHGFVGHGVYLYEDNLRIPLIMRWPGQIPRGRRVSQLVGNVDIAATILDAAKIHGKPVKNMDGKSLLPVIRRGEKIHQSLYFETYLCAHDMHAEIVEIEKGKKIPVGIRSYGVLEKPWKYIKTEFFPLFDSPDTVIAKEIRQRVKKQELFNLEQDPGELISVGRTAKGTKISLHLGKLLTQYTAPDKNGNKKNRIKLSDENLEKLKSLGYVE